MVVCESALRDTRNARACADDVREGLQNFERVYACLKPFEQRDLVRLVLDKAVVGDRELVLHPKGEACAAFAQAPKKAIPPNRVR